MATNTTFGNLKINLLRRSGNQYNANDTTRLQLAGNCINQALAIIQGEIKGHPFTLDTGNTIATVANQAYVTLLDTNIVEVLSVQERVDPNKLKWIPYTLYQQYMADPSRFTGTPNLYYTVIQSVVTGVATWQILFVPTPASVITIYYDYIKSLQFSSDTSTADAEYSPLVPTYDEWIYAEAKPMIYEIIDPGNDSMIKRSVTQAIEARQRYRSMILAGADQYQVCQSVRERGPVVVRVVDAVSLP